MSSVLLAPHADDETLFASFICLRERPHVVICLDDGEERWEEAARATALLGCTAERWTVPAANPDWSELEWMIAALPAMYDWCYAPSYNFERNGHHEGRKPPTGWGVLQHDMIGWLARKHFGERVTHYTTYLRWHGRETGESVEPEPEWVVRKLQALACYRSQIADPATRPHFLGPLTEYVA